MPRLLIFFLVVYLTTTSGTPNSKIVGGSGAFAGEFPFVAGLTIHTWDGNYFCAGTLLTNQWILTAGQCISSAIGFTITLGGITLTGVEATRIIVEAEIKYIHPEYRPNMTADLGLIKLRMPVELTDYIQPIALPTEVLPDNAEVVGVGWGQVSDESSARASTLQKVALVAIPNEVCKLTYGSVIIDSMVCVAGNYIEGTCVGDSGGPLIQYNSENQAIYVGLSSFHSGNGCETTDPSGYTRIEPFLEWITRVIRDF